MLALLGRVASGRGQGRFGGAVYAAEKQEKPLGMRDEGPKQGAGTKVEATTDTQTPWSLGREVKNTLNIALWSFYHTWDSLWKSVTFSLEVSCSVPRQP